MRPESLAVKKFRCYEDKTWDFKEGITRIYGPVGSGKSTIMKAMLCAIYGKHVPKNDGWWTCFTFTLSGQRYVFEREKGDFKLTIDGTLYGKNQKQRTEYVKENFVDYDTFISTLYYVQKNFSIFTSAKDSGKKELFAKIQNIGDFDLYLKDIKQKLSDMTSKQQRINGALDAIATGWTEEDLAKASLQVTAFNKNSDALMKGREELDTKISDIKTKIEVHQLHEQMRSAVAYKKQVEERIANTKIEIQDLETETKQLTEQQARLEEQCRQYKEQYNQLNGQKSSMASENAVLEKEISTAESLKQAKQCPMLKDTECPLVTEKADVLNAKIEQANRLFYQRVSEMTKLDSELQLANAGIAEAEQAIKQSSLPDKLAQLKAKLRSVKDAETELAGLKVESTSYADEGVDVDSLKNQLRDLIEARQKIVERIDEDLRQLAILKQQIESYNNGLQKNTELKAELETIEEEMSVYEELKEMFSKNGLPMYYTRKYIEYFTTQVNEVMAEISDYRVEIYTDRLTNGVDYAIDVAIRAPYGLVDYDDLSGGEQTMVDFAIGISLADLMMKRNGVKYGTIFFDEILGSLDDFSAERVVKVANVLKTKFESIFVISHKINLPDIFDHSIECEKTA